MEKILKDSIVPFVSEGRFSMSIIRELVAVRDFIDRVSNKKYITDESAESMIKRYGACPDIVTWGDYFQSDLAMVALDDEENFTRVVDTVRFDIMSAWDIFSTASPSMVEWIEQKNQELWISGKDRSLYTEEEEEILHLGILHEYYNDLGLNGNFHESELIWYNTYFEDAATGTEGVTIQ